MTTILDEILQTTKASKTTLSLQLENYLKKNREEVEWNIKNLFDKITYNWKTKIRNSALKGKYYNNIYFFYNQEELEYIFIMKEIYDKVNIVPLFDKLEKYFEEQGFEIYLVRKNGINALRVSWEKYFEKT